MQKHGLLLLMLVSTAAAQSTPQLEVVYDVPHLNGVVVDGQMAEWRERGFRVELMTAPNGDVPAVENFDPQFRLAWDERGILLAATVRDNELKPDTDQGRLTQGDAIELVLAPSFGAENHVHAVLSPDLSATPSVRVKSSDYRNGYSTAPIEIIGAASRIPEGYTLEALLPWTIFGIKPKRGLETALQVQVNDLDNAGGLFKATWFPAAPPSGRARAVHRIRLASRPSKPVRTVIQAHYDEFARTIVRVTGVDAFSGASVELRDNKKTLASSALQTGKTGRPQTRLVFSMPPVGSTYDALRLRINSDDAGAVELPDATVWRAQRLIPYAPRFNPPVFAGTRFPPCEFANPLLAERLLGPYRIETTFYNARYEKVTQADEPGRYGAVIDIVPAAGRPLRRFATLFRQPANMNVFDWWYVNPEVSVELPPNLGIDHGVMDAHARAFGTFVQWQLQDALLEDRDSAAVLAGMFETPKDSPRRTVYDDAFAMDRQWWVGLKRKLNGMDKAYPNPVVCPCPVEGPPAPTLRNGTAEEAGFKPEKVLELEALLDKWAADTDQAFAVCLARNSVVFFERAYGKRSGEPMTLDTKSWMASISKFLSGALMMTLVDQGLVDPDAPIDTYIPAMRGLDVETPLTVRHCFTHTSGLQLGITPPRMFLDHYGDEMNDLEEVIAGYYPHLEVATRHGYNGVGHALAGKVIEQVSGEALPQYFRNHLWGPLGCTHTDAVDMSARTMSTARDIATFAQMVLNKGAYGNMRFFSEATYEKMLPVKLARYVKFVAGDLEWGLGPVWTPEPGFGKKTFGHGAASSATLRIDPDNQLVVVMCRNAGGAKFGEYHKQFIQLVAEGLVEPKNVSEKLALAYQADR